MPQIAIVTDEVSPDFETAVELIRAWGVDFVEIRGIGDQRFPEVSEYWQLRVPELVREFRLQVAAISPGLFQLEFPNPPARMHFTRRGDVRQVMSEQQARVTLDHHVQKLLPASIEAAEKLGTRIIVCFSFGRPDHLLAPPASNEMIEVLRYAASKVGAAGMQLVIEVAEPCSRPADIVRRVDHPALGINWDPGSAYDGGEDVPYPDGFAQVRPYIRHVQFKDARTDPITGHREWVQDGVIDWAGALADLRRDGYDGFISVETHFRPKVAGTRALLERLRALLDEAHAEGVASSPEMGVSGA